MLSIKVDDNEHLIKMRIICLMRPKRYVPKYISISKIKSDAETFSVWGWKNLLVLNPALGCPSNFAKRFNLRCNICSFSAISGNRKFFSWKYINFAPHCCNYFLRPLWFKPMIIVYVIISCVFLVRPPKWYLCEMIRDLPRPRLDPKLKKSWLNKQDETRKTIKSQSNILDQTYWDLAETWSRMVS